MNPLIGIPVVLAGLAIVALAREALTERAERRRFPPPGRLVDVGGFRLHVLESGDSSASPTVILDLGMVSFSSNWAWVQPELAKVTRVVASIAPGWAGAIRARSPATPDGAPRNCTPHSSG